MKEWALQNLFHYIITESVFIKLLPIKNYWLVVSSQLLIDAGSSESKLEYFMTFLPFMWYFTSGYPWEHVVIGVFEVCRLLVAWMSFCIWHGSIKVWGLMRTVSSPGKSLANFFLLVIMIKNFYVSQKIERHQRHC